MPDSRVPSGLFRPMSPANVDKFLNGKRQKLKWYKSILIRLEISREITEIMNVCRLFLTGNKSA